MGEPYKHYLVTYTFGIYHAPDEAELMERFGENVCQSERWQDDILNGQNLDLQELGYCPDEDGDCGAD